LEAAKWFDGTFVRALAGGSCQILLPAAKRGEFVTFAALESLAAAEFAPPLADSLELLPWNGFHQ
jgi:hypothetical protein